MSMKPHKTNRNSSFVRFQRARIINKKSQIVKHIWSSENELTPKQKGQFAKGKVHCSCKMCSAKEKLHGPKVSYVKKLDSMDSQLDEY